MATDELNPSSPFSYHDDRYLPMKFGPADRTPAYGHPDWGILTPPERIVASHYALEWASGTPRQFELVRSASREAGLYIQFEEKGTRVEVDYPTILQGEAARVVSSLISILDRHPTEKITLLDVGAGPGGSALAIYSVEQLSYAERERLKIILLDPSEESLVKAHAALREAGAREDQIEIIHGIDLDLEDYPANSIDILTGVASVHHHAEIPFDLYYRVLAPGGFAVFADWHNSIWEHPYRVYEFLRKFPPTPRRELMLQKWLEWYPQAETAIPEPERAADRKANEEITLFWLAYERLLRQEGDFGENAIWPLEGHRPVGKYIEGMQAVGFDTSTTSGIKSVIRRGAMRTNPHQILPGSRLLMVSVGQKHEHVKKPNPDVELLTAREDEAIYSKERGEKLEAEH